MKDEYVLLDCDGVLSDFVGACKQACHDMGFVFNYDGTHYDVFRDMESRHKGRLIKYFHREGFVLDMDPLEGALEGVALLREEGHRVLCLTSPWRTKKWEAERREWLKEHFSFRGKDVIQTPRKSLVRGITLVDDKPAHCQSWGQCNGSPALLWDRTYNREPLEGRPDQLDVIRVRGWRDVLAALDVM